MYDNEDVADEFATVFMVMSHHQQAALAAAQWWATSGTREEAMSKLYSDDRHTVSPQRARNIMRWLGEQDELVRRWQKIILPNMQDEALRKALSSTDKFDRASVEAELRRRGE